MSIVLYLGNKTYSSWSMRAGLALDLCGAPYEEVVIPLDQPDTSANIAPHSPSGRVPALAHDDVLVWDSLAIVEYLHECFPAAKLWPTDRAARAHARSMCAEMHSGFAKMREKMFMHLKRAPVAVAREAQLDADIARIQRMWRDCRARFGSGGEFLFGAPNAADCFFAPVVTRFRTYKVDVDDVARAYMSSVENWGPFKKWKAGALAEASTMPRYEPPSAP
jgi:glutathione S-transferase